MSIEKIGFEAFVIAELRAMRFAIEVNTKTLLELTEKVNAMAQDQATLDTEIAQVLTDLAGFQAQNAAVLAKLSSIVPGTPAPDFSAEIATLTSIDQKLQALNAADLTALAPPATGAAEADAGSGASTDEPAPATQETAAEQQPETAEVH